MAAKQKANASALLQLRKQSRSGVQIGFVAIGRICPDRIVDDLSGLFGVHVERCFHTVDLLPRIAVAAMADGGRFCGSIVLVVENTAKGGCGIDLSMRGE